MHSFSAAEHQFDENLLKISSDMDDFEGYIRAHGTRIAAIAEELAKRFNLATHDRYFLKQAALIHDVGELIMAREYISAGRNLSGDEHLDMQRHPVIGEQESAKLGLPRGVQLLIRWHHEWWNGSGYPDGLAGGQIPLAARILRVADTFAALTDSRPFRPAINIADARKYMIEWAAIEFDPRVVSALLTLENLKEIESFAVKIN